MSFLELAIYEAENNGEIDLDTRNDMLSVLNEGCISPIKKFIERVKTIRQSKPEEYDGPREVKQFIDKNGDDIISAAKILEQEPEKLRKVDIIYVIGFISIWIGTLVTLITNAFFAPIIGSMLLVIISLVYIIIGYVRRNDDIKVSNDLSKIRSSLKKINTSKLPDEYKKKLSEVITAIDDAETEISDRIKVQKESVLIKIYEAELSGNITPEERKNLIDYLNG